MATNLTRNIILKYLQQKKKEIKERYSVKTIGLFGSYAAENAISGSDLDILVEFEHPTFDNYMDLKFYLEELFQITVDLVIADTVKPRIKPIIEREVIYA